jgi:hypothetical protein
MNRDEPNRDESDEKDNETKNNEVTTEGTNEMIKEVNK